MRALLVALALLASPAAAQENEVANALFCDTQEQIEEVIAAYDDGQEQAAVAKINRDNKTSCMILTAAFLRGSELKVITVHNGLMHVVQVVVIAVMGERETWQRIQTPTIQYIGVLEKQESI